MTSEEQVLYQAAAALGKLVAEKFLATTTPEQRKRMAEGFEAWQRLSWADRLRYEDWTPMQLQAFLPLIQAREG